MFLFLWIFCVCGNYNVKIEGQKRAAWEHEHHVRTLVSHSTNQIRLVNDVAQCPGKLVILGVLSRLNKEWCKIRRRRRVWLKSRFPRSTHLSWVNEGKNKRMWSVLHILCSWSPMHPHFSLIKIKCVVLLIRTVLVWTSKVEEPNRYPCLVFIGVLGGICPSAYGLRWFCFILGRHTNRLVDE